MHLLSLSSEGALYALFSGLFNPMNRVLLHPLLIFAEVAAASRLTLTAGTHQLRLAIPCGGADFDYLSFAPSPPDELFLPVMLKP